MDDVLARALEPVSRDLRSTGGPVFSIEDKSWTTEPGYPSVMLRSPDGTGVGVSVDAAATEPERVASVADQVQEWVIEELWGHAPTNWPRCPQHPHTHPLQASSDGSEAVWACPVDGMVAAPVGSL